jgi:GT2 family glycosyltransferase
MRLWVCIPVHNRLHLTLACLESLSQQGYDNFAVIVCDDGSTDGTASVIKQRHPETTLLHGDGNLWWTGATNCCVEYVLKHAADCDAVVTLNNDLEVQPDYLQKLANVARRYPWSIVGSAMHDIQTRSLVSPGYRQDWLIARSRAVDPAVDHIQGDTDVAAVTHVSGRGTLIPLAVFKTIGLYDSKRLPHYGADYDFAHAARRAGFGVYICFSAKVYSHVAETGMTTVRSDFSLRGLWNYFTNQKSPANIRVRWWLAVKNCPKTILPIYLLFDFLRVTGSYFKFHLLRTVVIRHPQNK